MPKRGPLPSPEACERIRAAGRARWKDPEKRARYIAARKLVMADPMQKALVGEMTLIAWADEQKRQQRCDAIKAAMAKPEVKAKVGKAVKASWKNPAVRAKRPKAWLPPEPFRELFATLKKKLGAGEARRYVEADMARAARRAIADEARPA